MTQKTRQPFGPYRPTLGEALRRAAEAPPSGEPVRMFLVRDQTLEGLEPFFQAHLREAGLWGEVRFGGFGEPAEELLSDRWDPATTDLVVLALGTVPQDPEAALARLDRLLALLEARCSAPVVLNPVLRPLYVMDGFGVSAVDEAVERYNHGLRARVAEAPGRRILVDWERILMQTGPAGLDGRMALISRAPLAPPFMERLAARLAAAARALRGRGRKWVALDCDNTLWGGIVGEDGLEGIALDPYAYPGNAYHAFQRTLLNLQARGVLLTLCSKNNPSDVLEVLERQPHCLLRPELFAAIRINWEDKVGNLAALAAELNLGVDSGVFVDDSPMECDLAANRLPGLTVRQVPERLSDLPDMLLVEGLFDTLQRSEEDGRRTEMLQAEQARRQLSVAVPDLEAYLQQLAITLDIHPITPEELPRASQLCQKTNQFNLTTHRYTEHQLCAWANAPDWALFTVSVRDAFGDSGLTGLFIAHRKGTSVRIDTFLLSCRVLGRKVEYAFFAACVEALRVRWAPETWEAEYLPTSKNTQVAGFWVAAGLKPLPGAGEGIRYWGQDAELRAEWPTFILREGS